MSGLKPRSTANTPPRHWSRTATRLIAAVLAVFLATFSTWSATGVAQAVARSGFIEKVCDGDRCGFRVWYDFNNDDVLEDHDFSLIGTFGSISGSDGHRVICINSGADVPTSLADPVLKTTDPELAYIMANYIDVDTSKTDAQNELTAAAVAHIVKGKLDESPSKRDKFWGALSDTQQTNISNRADELTTEGCEVRRSLHDQPGDQEDHLRRRHGVRLEPASRLRRLLRRHRDDAHPDRRHLHQQRQEHPVGHQPERRLDDLDQGHGKRFR